MKSASSAAMNIMSIRLIGVLIAAAGGLTVNRAFQEQVGTRGYRPALEFGETVRTYAELPAVFVVPNNPTLSGSEILEL